MVYTAFLRGVKRCYRLYHIRNEDIREELRIFDVNDKLRDCK